VRVCTRILEEHKLFDLVSPYPYSLPPPKGGLLYLISGTMQRENFAGKHLTGPMGKMLASS